jgi:hypothetical protein
LLSIDLVFNNPSTQKSRGVNRLHRLIQKIAKIKGFFVGYQHWQGALTICPTHSHPNAPTFHPNLKSGIRENKLAQPCTKFTIKLGK